MASKNINWLALESNPEVLNKALGVPGDKWQFSDVFGTDSDLLAMVPRPVTAVLLLFPITDNTEAEDKKELDKINQVGQTVSNSIWYNTKTIDIRFMKQTIGNACGTIAVLHSLANNEDKLALPEDSPLASYLSKTKNLTPLQRAEELVNRQDIAEAHTESAMEGQTKPPSADDDINLHFIAFIENGGELYEMDGRKPFPINHGKTSADTLLEDACKVISSFMARDPKEVSFSMLALTPPE